MTITIRLYWQYDLDLIGLYMDPEFHLASKIKEALQGYVRGRKVVFYIPTDPYPKRITIDNCAITISLNERFDADVIRFIKNIRLGHRNSAVKVILRSCFDRPFLIPYMYPDTYTAKSRVHNEPKGYTAKGKERKGTSRKDSVPNNIKNQEYYQEMTSDPSYQNPPKQNENTSAQKKSHESNNQDSSYVQLVEDEAKQHNENMLNQDIPANNTSASASENNEAQEKSDENSGFSIFDAVENMF